jgi:site-specific recombinase XerD
LKLSKIIEKWLAWYKEQDSAKNSSLEEYQQAVELFREVIGDKPFATVTTEDVEDYLFLLKS